MALTKETKKELVKKYQINKKDTGSCEVQVALLTKQINDLNEHLKVHKKDFHSRRGLYVLVGRRRSFLDHLKGQSLERYQKLIESLGLRR